MEFWTSLPAWVRYPVALGISATGVAIFLFSNPIPVGLAGSLLGFGFVLLLIGPSKSDKDGYNFGSSAESVGRF